MKMVESQARDFSSAEAFVGAAELVGDKVEFDMVCRLLSKPDEKITWERVLDEAMVCGMDWAALDKLKKGFEKVGFPSEEEPMETEFLTPQDIEGILSQDNNGYAIFNNEFALFTYALGKKLEDFQPTTIIDMAVQLNPVRQRLRSLAPSLVGALEEYGAERPSMSKFYGGLSGEGMPSWHYVTLFTIADQLLQRLVRPGDRQYMVACAREWSGLSDKTFEAPMYETMTLTPDNIVTNARNYLYT